MVSTTPKRAQPAPPASSTVENYLKQLFRQQRANGNGMVSMGSLAAAMGVAPGTATSMAKSLAESGLARYAPRTGVRLSPAGEQLALHVIRRHRLVELFLVKVLQLDWSVVDDEAERLEHAISDRVLERMDALLDFPTADPHGDPIPSAGGRLHEPRRLSLANCPLGAPQRIARVLDQDPNFLQFVERVELVPGAVVTVVSRLIAAGAVQLQRARREPISLGLPAAGSILVEPRQVAGNTSRSQPRRERKNLS